MITEFCVGLPVILISYLIIFLYSRFFLKYVLKLSDMGVSFLKYFLGPILSVAMTVLGVGIIWLIVLAVREVGMQIMKLM